jgi:signal transduction histidine kinase
MIRNLPLMPTLRLAGYQHIVLLAVLCMFVLAVHERPDTVFGRLLWVIDVGLFLLWQPIISSERRLTVPQALVVHGVVLFMALNLNWGWLAAWGVFIASLVGGKVIVARSRRLGWFFLLAFACIALVLFTWVSPMLFDESARGRVDPPAAWVLWAGFGSLVAAAIALPWGKVRDDVGVYDFLISLLILLVLSFVLMLTNGLMVVRRVSHLDALVSSLLSLGFLILLLSWAWNPRLGFSGLGALASRYLLRLGFPFEDWLRQVSETFDREADPDAYLRQAIATFNELPWVVGGVADRAGAEVLRFGTEEKHSVRLEYEGVGVTLFTTYHWTAALIWQANLLLKLVVDFYRAKERERQLQQMRYLEAVHEAGSRVTHDVKNLLQSLEGLCFAAERADDRDSAEFAGLMRRQLPVVAQRLRLTLDKLSSGQERAVAFVPLSLWWAGVQERYQGQKVAFAQSSAVDGEMIPAAVFDNVVDNLLTNAGQKRAATPDLRITVTLDSQGGQVVLRVGDDGDPVPELVAATLFSGPVVSANGLGVGLYHSARLAERHGYALRLASNQAGSIEFLLASAGS